MIGEDRWNINARQRLSFKIQLAQFVGAMSLAIGLYYIGDHIRFFAGTIPKQYPEKGKVHYTFESKDSE